MMPTLIRKNYYFFIPYLLFLIAGIILLLTLSKGELLLRINTYHNNFLDTLFYQSTRLGEGVFLALLILVLLFTKFRYAILALISYITTGCIAQIIKHCLEIPRPKVFLPDFHTLHQVDDIVILSSNSFPSGHATSIFTLFCVLSLITKKKELGLVFIIMAITGSFSRIYLLQHFFIDIYIGSLIGVIISYCLYMAMNKYLPSKNTWIDMSLLKLIK